MDFAELSSRAQVHRLRRVAFEALERYPVDVERVRLVEHGFNTTFRVDSVSGEKYALRIDVSRRKPLDVLDGEMAWLAALASDTEITVPVPQATLDDQLHTRVLFEPIGAMCNVALMSWLPGRNLDDPTPEAMRELGRITAELHRHAAAWDIPPGAGFPPTYEVLMDSPDQLRSGHPLISTENQAFLVEVLDHVEALQAEMVAAGTRIPIHGDLHMMNVKWLRGRMSVFDFDDAGMGVPAQDLSITSFYLRDDSMGECLFEGYQTVSALPVFTTEQFEASLAGRNLLLLNDVLQSQNSDLRSMTPGYIDKSVARLRLYMDSGVFALDVPGWVDGD